MARPLCEVAGQARNSGGVPASQEKAYSLGASTNLRTVAWGFLKVGVSSWQSYKFSCSCSGSILQSLVSETLSCEPPKCTVKQCSASERSGIYSAGGYGMTCSRDLDSTQQETSLRDREALDYWLSLSATHAAGEAVSDHAVTWLG